MGGGSGGSGSGGRSGGGSRGAGTDGDAGQPGEVVRQANNVNERSAADVRYEMDQMESGTRYAVKNYPGGNVLSNQDIRDLEKANKPARVKSKQELSRERQRAAALEAKRNPDKGTWKFPSNPKKGDTVVNGYGATRTWTGTYWD